MTAASGRRAIAAGASSGVRRAPRPTVACLSSWLRCPHRPGHLREHSLCAQLSAPAGDSRALHSSAAIPDPGTPASSDGAQSSTSAGRAGRWLAPGGVSCLTFISRPSPPRRTHRPCCLCCAALLARRPLVSPWVSLSLSQPSATPLRVKLRGPRYCIPSTLTLVAAPGPARPDPSTTTAPAIITIMSQKHAPDRARKYKEDPAPVASQKLVSNSASLHPFSALHLRSLHLLRPIPRPFCCDLSTVEDAPSPSTRPPACHRCCWLHPRSFACCSSLCKPRPPASSYPSRGAPLPTWYALPPKPCYPSRATLPCRLSHLSSRPFPCNVPFPAPPHVTRSAAAGSLPTPGFPLPPPAAL
jgi:hypothetical protein